MPTISLCMIVKNEAEVLARCLDSIADLMDEIIIVDTGSTDSTKEIAEKYTGQVYDFPWNYDFSAARNFSFSKASMDYIYAPDADEVLDEENHSRFALLKSLLEPEIELVQMKYKTVSGFDTVLNARKEYRPKLFKRLRTFTWVDRVHETIRINPVIYDSDIEILHMPQNLHSQRDFTIFQQAFEQDGFLSDKLRSMYAKELLKSGSPNDFMNAKEAFQFILTNDGSPNGMKEASCILAHIYRLENNKNEFFKLTMKDMLTTPCAEICYELGSFFYQEADYSEAIMWFYNAAYETASILDIRTSGILPLQGLADCYNAMLAALEKEETPDRILISDYKYEAEKYQAAADEWQMPIEM